MHDATQNITLHVCIVRMYMYMYTISTCVFMQRHSSGGGVGLTSEEAAVVRETKEEYARRGSWVRIFPTEDSWDLYGSVKKDIYAGFFKNFICLHIHIIGLF